MNVHYDNELNLRLNKRNIPSTSLKPNFDFRPQPTKYTDFQIVDQPTESNINLLSYSENTFNPGDRGPTNKYLEKVDLESHLRNQYMALQRDSQSEYVPKINSDLYKNPMNYEKEYTGFNPSTVKPMCKKLDPNIFHNSTRYYLKKE